MNVFKQYGKHARPNGAQADEPSEASEEPIAEDAPDSAEGDSSVSDVLADEEDAQKASGLNQPEPMDDPDDGEGTAADESEGDAASQDAGADESDESDDSDEPEQSDEAQADQDATSDADADVTDGDGESGEDAPEEAEAPAGDGLPDEAFEPREFKAEDLEDDEDEDDEDEPEPVSAKSGKHSTDAAPGGFVAAGFDMPNKRKRRGLKAFAITLGVLVVALGAIYLAGAFAFSTRFLPNTTIGEYDVSLKSDEEVEQLLDRLVSGYQIDVIGKGFSYRMTGKDLGLSIDSDSIVQAMHGDQDRWQWPLLVFESSHDESEQMAVGFNRDAFRAAMTEAVNKHNESATPPTNATIAFDEATGKYVIKEEKPGTQLNAEPILARMEESIIALQPKLELTDDDLVAPSVLATDAKLIESAELASGMVSAELSLVMSGQSVGKVTSDTLSQFITIDENLDVTFKEDEMNAWIDSLARDFNTVGTSRSFTREDGKRITVEGGVYGWEIDAEALKNAVRDGIKAGEKAEVEVPCSETAAVYNGLGERDWGNRYIDVDISEQHVRFYGDDGKVFWETDCISGSPDGNHDTWPGVWRVNAKESPSKLIGYENGKKIYETTVTYWMPFEGNGIGFHDATWQPSFGGSMYANGYGSHGCVNLSFNAAKELYDIIQEGDVVVVHS